MLQVEYIVCRMQATQKIWLRFFLHESACLKYNLDPGSFSGFECLKDSGDLETYHKIPKILVIKTLAFSLLMIVALTPSCFYTKQLQTRAK